MMAPSQKQDTECSWYEGTAPNKVLMVLGQRTGAHLENWNYIFFTCLYLEICSVQTWSHIMLYRVEYTSPWVGLELTLVVLVSDCTDSCISNYHTITTMIEQSFNGLEPEDWCSSWGLKLHIFHLFVSWNMFCGGGHLEFLIQIKKYICKVNNDYSFMVWLNQVSE
jgi:hypothetical protein